MAETYVHDSLPFPENLGTPANIFVQILVRGEKKLFIAAYRVNSYDGCLYLGLRDVSNDIIVCTMKIVKDGNFFVRDENGRIMFVLLVRDDDVKSPDIMILNEEQMEQFAI